MKILKEYEKIAGKEQIEQLRIKAEPLKDKHILCINSTSHGGGVAEMLNSSIVLFNLLDIDFGWRTLHGSSDFFNVTKGIHNSLQGESMKLTRKKKNIYYDTNKMFSIFTHVDHDMVIVHDPQPLPLIDFYEKKQPWICRFHMDLSYPDMSIWRYIRSFVNKYDHFVVSKEEYKKRLDVPQSIMYPAIDPLSPKNRPVNDRTVRKMLEENDIDRSIPIITQISRFDKWKDPTGVIKIFEKVRRKEKCQLALIGSFSVDDPEGQKIFEKTERMKQESRYGDNIKLMLNTTDVMVNCMQKESAVVIQKSLREGFGLVVSEALFKGTPVVASNVGGIPFQVLNGMNGFLRDPNDIEGFSACILKLLRDEKLRNEMGRRGKLHVTNNFLVTRLMIDWMNLISNYLLPAKNAR
ncbi:MAG: glycosyltransferase [Candidatus Aenigmarchaeota archaeon]|nr:glycosyltransferase [Candidatus Aenigmarchaeota archaeon]